MNVLARKIEHLPPSKIKMLITHNLILLFLNSSGYDGKMDPEIENFVRFWLRSRYNLAEVDEVGFQTGNSGIQFSDWVISGPIN